ncbi:MAG: hypothetical protein HFI73_04230 [Bacilli bacterium]|jgi:hypothetical protein|nr:hypothetical protein [Bacilli bacterium]
MKKMNKKVNNVLYALVYELIFIPLLSYVSYYIYTRLNYIGIINENLIFSSLILIVLVILNLLAVYYIAYALNHVFKFNLEYQIVIGFIIIFITIWIKMYYNSLENILCQLEGGSGCLEAARYNKLFSIVLIFVVTYNLLYVPLHKITKRKGKKIKLSLK